MTLIETIDLEGLLHYPGQQRQYFHLKGYSIELLLFHHYRLQLQLKNNLAWPQEWPTLVLSFNDAAAAGMATMAIEPSQYLPADQVGLPFAAGAQQSIRLPVVIKGKKINGFSVDKYYP